jgi:kinesin family protein 18/19
LFLSFYKASKPLALREDPEKGCHVAGLSEYSPTSADEVMKLLEIGNSRRTQHPTDANSQSSRSHAVLQVLFIVIAYQKKPSYY